MHRRGRRPPSCPSSSGLPSSLPLFPPAATLLSVLLPSLPVPELVTCSKWSHTPVSSGACFSSKHHTPGVSYSQQKSVLVSAQSLFSSEGATPPSPVFFGMLSPHAVSLPSQGQAGGRDKAPATHRRETLERPGM